FSAFLECSGRTAGGSSCLTTAQYAGSLPPGKRNCRASIQVLRSGSGPDQSFTDGNWATNHLTYPAKCASRADAVLFGGNHRRYAGYSASSLGGAVCQSRAASSLFFQINGFAKTYFIGTGKVPAVKEINYSASA